MRLQANLDAATDTLNLYRDELEKSRIIAQSRTPLYETVDTPEMAVAPDKTGRGPIIALLLLCCLGLAVVKPVQEWVSLQRSSPLMNAQRRGGDLAR